MLNIGTFPCIPSHKKKEENSPDFPDGAAAASVVHIMEVSCVCTKNGWSEFTTHESKAGKEPIQQPRRVCTKKNCRVAATENVKE